jgi:nitrite reductase (NADH) small subunit
MRKFLVCKSEEIPRGRVRIVEVDHAEIAIINHRGEFYAYRNFCPHQGGPACEGKMMPQVVDYIGIDGSYQGQTFDETDPHIVCPWHGYEFHLSDGTHVCDKRLRLHKYKVSNEGGDVYLEI